MDQTKLSFAERLKLKSSSGFDTGVREKFAELKERAADLQNIKSEYRPGSKMPK